MIKIERILCPIASSVDSSNALRYAVSLARSYRAKLFVLTCVEGETNNASFQEQLPTEEQIKLEIERVFNQKDRDRRTVTLDWESLVIANNSPVEVITKEAARLAVDLIVMCSRRRPLRAALLGSTAESVYRTAPCPVLITHPDQREWVDPSTGLAALKRVLVAHDFSDYSELALLYSLSFAQEYQSELHLLHVVPAPVITEPEIAWTASSTESVYHKAARSLQKSIPDEAYLWCDIKTSVRWGKPYREVLAYAKENDIDLIFMGAHGAGFGIQTLFGSNADRILRQSPCPTVVARPLKPLATDVPRQVVESLEKESARAR
jgi:nucleotide-binding universal stress UspA family protein